MMKLIRPFYQKSLFSKNDFLPSNLRCRDSYVTRYDMRIKKYYLTRQKRKSFIEHAIDHYGPYLHYTVELRKKIK